MKMGTIVSLWRYDVGSCRALNQHVYTDCDFALRFCGGCRLPDNRLPFDSGLAAPRIGVKR